VRIEEHEVVGRLRVDERHLHARGFVHGGVWVALADTVAAWGALRNLSPEDDFSTVELKSNVYAVARDGDELTAVGRPLHVGRRTQVWEVRIAVGERPAAFFACTQVILPGHSGAQG
jgi:1,4-dihydroxy-2-naphthoyl-CoA hydrolase